MIETAVITAGGSGLRLLPLTQDRPKTMVEISSKPILYWILKWLKSYGVKHVVIGVSYKKEKIIEYVQQNDFGMKIDISEHTIEGETGEGFRLAITRFVKDEDFLALNADQITNLNLIKLFELHESKNKIITMVLAPLQSPYSIVNVNSDGLVDSFNYKPIMRDKLVSNGIYIFNKQIISYLPQKGPIETTTFLELTKEKQVNSYLMSDSEWWVAVDSIKDVSKAEEILTKNDFKE